MFPKISGRLRSPELPEVRGRTADHMADSAKIVGNDSGKRWLLTADNDVKSVFCRSGIVRDDREVNPDAWMLLDELGRHRCENESRIVACRLNAQCAKGPVSMFRRSVI